MDAARTVERKPGHIQRTFVWIRDHILAALLLAIITPALFAYLGLNSGGLPVPGTNGDDGKIQVANVYNLPRDRGLQYLNDQGFKNVRVIGVCSNSVAGGRIREVLLDDNSGLADETVLDGPTGAKPIEIALDTKILVKVSTGKPCS